MKTLHEETIRPQDESFLSKIPGISRDWLLEISINQDTEDERIIQATWKSERKSEEIFDIASVSYAEIYEEDFTKLDRIGRGETVMADLGEKEKLVYTEETGHITYTGPSHAIENLKELIEETHSYEDSDVEYAVGRLNELADEYLE